MARGRGKSSEGRSLFGRADARQSGSGAGALFARLDALDGSAEARQAPDAAELLARWAERLRAGLWSEEIAALVAHAEALERALGEGEHS